MGSIAIVHTYKSGLLPYLLKHILSFEKGLIEEIRIVFCRWNTFPDLGRDENIKLVLGQFNNELRRGTIKINLHEGSFDHNEFECRSMMMNRDTSKSRFWADSDELFMGRYWWFEHAQPLTAYKIRHLVFASNGLQEFEGVPYLFGAGVKIRYLEASFLSLEPYSDIDSVPIEKIMDLTTICLQTLETAEYRAAKQKWIASW